MQTTRWQPSRVIAAICLVFTIALVYFALRLRTSDEDQQISYGLKMKNRIAQRAKEVRFEGYDTDGSETLVDQDEATDPPIKLATNPSAGIRSWHPVDARSVRCRKRSAASLTTVTRSNISLIVDFRLPADNSGVNLLIDRLQLTVGSLIGGSQFGIDELIFVGHGPSAAASRLANDSRLSSYFANLKLPRSRLLVKAGGNQATARMSGVAESKGFIVIFADDTVIGTVGWLHPLVTSLVEANDEKTIVQPHLDDASRFPAEYAKTSESTIPDYSWPLTIVLDDNAEFISPSPQIKGRFKSPVVRGNIFAVKRTFFKAIGGYDEKLMKIVSEDSRVTTHLELSFRTWMCGGTILTAPCSRVGIRDLAVSRRMSVVNRPSAERITELWFGNRTEILLTGVSAQFHHPSSVTSRSKRARATTEHSKCENINWYFNTVATGSRVPTFEAIQFGQLRSLTGLCAHVGDDNHVDVVDCTHAATFERTASGQITAGDDGCLSVRPDSFVLIEACQHQRNGEDKNEDTLRQEWRYDATRQQLVNPWSTFCAMHVTDPRNGTISWRQIVMAQNCSAEALSRTKAFQGSTPEQFTRWAFVNV